MLQRLPLFLLVDASDSMERGHADTLNRALRMVINRISEDLYAVESVVISLIVFSGKSQVNVLHRFSYAYHCGFSDISSLGGAADYGAGFGALFREMTDGVVRPSGSAPGDLRPLVFFFTAGSSPGTAGHGLSDRAAQISAGTPMCFPLCCPENPIIPGPAAILTGFITSAMMPPRWKAS